VEKKLALFLALFGGLLQSEAWGVPTELTSWQVCNSDNSNCTNYQSGGDLWKDYNWTSDNAKLKTKIPTTNACFKDSACWLFLGEIADSAEIKINSRITTIFKKYIKNQSTLIPISISESEKELLIEVNIIDLDGALFGLRTKDIAVGSFEDLSKRSLRDFLSRTGSSILSAFTLILLSNALLISFFITKNKTVLLLAVYSLMTGIYHLSFAEIGRQLLFPPLAAGPLHFSLRLIQDTLLLITLLSYFGRKKYQILATSSIYLISIVSLWIAWVSGFQSLKTFHLMMYSYAPLIAAPVIIGALLFSDAESTFDKKVLFPFFILLLILQANDLLVFWQVYSGIYFIRWYPTAIVILISLGFLKKSIAKTNQLERSHTLGQIATQVAHDIRSPLAALSMAERDLSALPEETRLIIRSAIGRIQDIASQLMARAHENKVKAEDPQDPASATPEQLEPTLVSATLETLLAEKRMQYRSRLGITIDSHIESAAHPAFAAIGPREFKRVVSNLINNAAESIPLTKSGSIRLELKRTPNKDSLVLEVTDTGEGIPPQILSKLGTRGFTHNKTGGSGLGIHHARTTIESWAGQLDIQSTVGQGSTLRIALPTCAPPSWFLPSLELAPNTQLVILDDDQSIHQVWKGRMESAQAAQHQIQLLHFSRPEEIARWLKERKQTEKTRPIRYLLDFEILGSPTTGLDLIEQLGIHREAVLVTSRYEEPSLRSRCATLQVPILPKALAGFVTISFSPASDSAADTAPLLDAVLLDDDPLIHMTWAHAAKVRGKHLKIFRHPDELQTELNRIPPHTPIYIDSNLGSGVKGEDWIQKLGQMGFKNLFLATGYHPKKFEDRLKGLPGFQGIVGKEPPKWT